MPEISPSSRPYRHDAVSVGPFESEPFDLMPIVLGTPDEPTRTGEEVTSSSEAWLTGVLNAAGVALSTYDRTAIRLLAEDGWTTVQVVSGWIARANKSRSDESETTRPDSDSEPT